MAGCPASVTAVPRLDGDWSPDGTMSVLATVEGTQRAALALYPQLRELGELIAAAAADDGGGDGAAQPDAEAEAAAPGAASAAADAGGDAHLPHLRLGALGGRARSAGDLVRVGSSEAVAAAEGRGQLEGAGGAPRRQEKNARALNALRRIKCKLDGRDRWPGKERERQQSVEEQVEMVIRQATSADALSQMYEGWAGWV